MSNLIEFNCDVANVTFNCCEVITNAGKKMQVGRVLNLSDFSYSNTTETNYLPFVWFEIDTNTFKTFGITGQTDLNPDNYEAFTNASGGIIEKQSNYILISGGFANDWQFIVREI